MVSRGFSSTMLVIVYLSLQKTAMNFHFDQIFLHQTELFIFSSLHLLSAFFINERSSRTSNSETRTLAINNEVPIPDLHQSLRPKSCPARKSLSLARKMTQCVYAHSVFIQGLFCRHLFMPTLPRERYPFGGPLISVPNERIPIFFKGQLIFSF